MAQPQVGKIYVGMNQVFPGFIPPPGILDDYPNATVAYSLRKLSRASTYAVEVRRSNDDATQNIGFRNQTLDTGSLISFVGANSAYITKWYDQSGNNNHAIQATSGNQPRIVNAGTIEVVNGLPAMNFDGTDDYFDLTSNVPTSNTTAWLNVFNRTSGTHNMTLGITATNVPFGPYWFSDNNYYYAPCGGCGGSSGRISNNTGQQLLFSNGLSGNVGFYLNNSLITGTIVGYTYNLTNYTVFGRRDANYLSGLTQEFILWNADKSTDRVGIQNNVNSYYNIYS